MGHPVRVRVLELLQQQPRTVRELLDEIEVEPSNLSQQLAVLRRSGLVTSEREGSSVRYVLATGVASGLGAQAGLATAVVAGTLVGDTAISRA